MQKFLSELQRRKVLRVASGYVVVAWVILQVALSLQAAMKLPDWFSTVIVSLLIIGFPIAVVTSWFFEFTPDGIKRTVPSSDIARFKPQTTDFALAGALVLVLAAVGVQLATPAAPTVTTTTAAPKAEPAPSAASIAVLPFADLSPAKDQEYFSDGMAEEILNVLAKVKGLAVASRTSSFSFKDRELGVPDIARQLKVRHVLEGSVRKAGATVRITAQLIDTATDRHLWSETFDRPLTADNIFTVQDEIAKAIVKALNETMGAGAKTEAVAVKPVTDNMTAYDLFLQARPLFLGRIDLDKADALLARAVEQDPHFAEAWEIRAALQSLMVDYGYSSALPAEVEKRTVEFANRAIAITPKSGLAIAAVAKLRLDAAEILRERGDFEGIIRDLEQSIAYDPRNSSARIWLANAYRDLGDLPRALKMFKECAEIDPEYTPCLINQVTTLSSLGREAEALAVYRKMLDNGALSVAPPFYVLAKLGLEYEFKSLAGSRNLLLGWRRHNELYEAHRHPERDYPGLIADIRQFSQKHKNISDSSLTVLISPVAGYDGAPDNANCWEPKLTRYRNSKPFKTWIKDSGVFDYWKKHGFPPLCKPAGTDDFACD